MDYTGTIVEESLSEPGVLDEIRIVGFKISSGEGSEERWHLYTVEVKKEQIEKISHCLKSEKWYAHFWKGKEVIVAYKDKTFAFNFDDKESWKPAVEYGVSIGIPLKQLDFPIE